MRFIPLLLFVALITPWLAAAPPAELEYPKIKGHGGVFRIAGEPEIPQSGSKVVVDVTAGDEDGGVNKGFARAARFIDLFVLGGVGDFKMAIVLHGSATKEALSDEAYTKLFGKKNPNREQSANCAMPVSKFSFAVKPSPMPATTPLKRLLNSKSLFRRPRQSSIARCRGLLTCQSSRTFTGEPRGTTHAFEDLQWESESATECSFCRPRSLGKNHLAY